jgi:hypothetical protein
MPDVAPARRRKERSMQVICAWCAKEGKPALLQHKPPLDDTSMTHSICNDHLARVRSEIRTRFALPDAA